MNRLLGRPFTFKHVAIGVGVGFFIGVVTMSYFQYRMATAAPQTSMVSTQPEPSLVPAPRPEKTKDKPLEPPAAPELITSPSVELAGAEADLRNRKLDVPVKGVARGDLRDSFNDRRDSARTHEAIDILAPRNTPVLAVENGTVVKLFLSKAGGITVYQFDPSSHFVYYYAHLEKYADGLAEGDKLLRGQVLGYVGTSGNAPKDTPHLHFAIFQLDEKKQWWKGTPLDPYPILK